MTTTTFVRRASTPLIKNMISLEESIRAIGDVRNVSFFKWSKKLAQPIRYQVTKAHNQSVYTAIYPLEDNKCQWNNRGWQKNEKIIKGNNFWHCGDLLFLDPAIMGIKRRVDLVPPSHCVDGVDFIRYFQLIFLRHRQCSVIEAHMLQQGLTALHGGH